jgi:hypothetical protein
MDIRDKQRTRKLASSTTEWTTCWRALNGGETCTPSEVRWGRRERAMSTGKRRSTQRQMWRRISRREAVHGGRGSGLHQRSGRHHHTGSAVLRSSTFRANRSHRTLGVTTLTLTRTGTRPVNTSGSSPASSVPARYRAANEGGHEQERVWPRGRRPRRRNCEILLKS